MLSGVFDYKRFSKTPITSQSSNTVSNTVNINVDGPQGPPGVINFDISNGFVQGDRGPQGDQGPQGNIKLFAGGAIDISFVPYIAYPGYTTEIINNETNNVTTIESNNDVTVGTSAQPFGAGYFNTGRFGFLETSGNTVIPRRAGTIDIVSKCTALKTKRIHLMKSFCHTTDSHTISWQNLSPIFWISPPRKYFQTWI